MRMADEQVWRQAPGALAQHAITAAERIPAPLDAAGAELRARRARA
jgi:hypothetical protein